MVGFPQDMQNFLAVTSLPQNLHGFGIGFSGRTSTLLLVWTVLGCSVTLGRLKKLGCLGSSIEVGVGLLDLDITLLFPLMLACLVFILESERSNLKRITMMRYDLQ